ncbi:MAG: heliorhodopsin HeR [Ilumatobacter sp.]|uniref:heliorhodopsin HeR n=1 Tax=Ilumatobacter sp. TaxID=1967498 RepID=UPI00391CEB72
MSRRLRTANLVAGVFHLAQSVVFLAIVTDFDLPVTTSYATEDPVLLQGPPPTEIWFDVRVGYGVAAFSLLSALFHFLVATVARRTYDRAIANRQNPFRWIEYSLSATLMIVLIMMLLGEYDVGALIAVAGANASMILFGWIMERVNTPGSSSIDWYPFVFGCFAGAVPWIVGGLYFAGALGNADEAVPTWVWAIFFSVFALFNVFALNQFLQYKAVGKWRRYVFGEGVYIALSFVAKSALMWQVYFGTTR